MSLVDISRSGESPRELPQLFGDPARYALVRAESPREKTELPGERTLRMGARAPGICRHETEVSQRDLQPVSEARIDEYLPCHPARGSTRVEARS